MTAAETGSVDWQALFFDPAGTWANRLQSRARRRFGPSEDADAAYNFALDEISKERWQRLRSGYQSRGSADGFLAVTLANLLEEYAVRKYGRKRPPAWIKRLGTLWQRVHQMLCLQRLAPETIVDVLTAHDKHLPDDVRFAIGEVRRRVPNCGEYVGERNLGDDDDMDLRADEGSRTPPEVLDAESYAEVVDVLRRIVEGGSTQAAPPAGTLAALQSCLSITDRERLLLKLIYHEGYSVPRAARSLGLHEQKTRRTHKALLERLKRCLLDHGFRDR